MLTYITADGRTTEYQYHPSTTRIAKRISSSGAYPAGRTPVMETIETLDAQNRIWIMTNRRDDAMNAPVFSSHKYTFDLANRRTNAEREDGTKWDYDYDSRGQVTAGRKKLGTTLLAGTESTYDYDAIGNRTSATSGGGPAVAGGSTPVTRSVTYTANNLNQYSGVSQSPRSFDVIGRVPDADTGVTVNGTAPYEQTIGTIGGILTNQFRGVVTAAASGNTSGNYENVHVNSSAGTIEEYAGLKWVPGATVAPEYDFDGNMIANGRWSYTWDAENRLASISHTGSTSPAVPALVVEFTYDGFSRRTEKKVSTFNGSTWVESYRERYLYDGWNPIGSWRLQPADATHSTAWWKLRQHYVWGPDVSGSAQGAGGVGGLIKISDASAANGGWFPCYDGNGNITALVDAVTNGTATALYDYDAFGNPVRISGASAKLNPFRFSTKFTDDETELVYYGYRYYDAAQGRWLNRDPIGENGGTNLHSYCQNSAQNLIDINGLLPWPNDMGDIDASAGSESLGPGLGLRLRTKFRPVSVEFTSTTTDFSYTESWTTVSDWQRFGEKLPKNTWVNSSITKLPNGKCLCLKWEEGIFVRHWAQYSNHYAIEIVENSRMSVLQVINTLVSLGTAMRGAPLSVGNTLWGTTLTADKETMRNVKTTPGSWIHWLDEYRWRWLRDIGKEEGDCPSGAPENSFETRKQHSDLGWFADPRTDNPQGNYTKESAADEHLRKRGLLPSLPPLPKK